MPCSAPRPDAGIFPLLRRANHCLVDSWMGMLGMLACMLYSDSCVHLSDSHTVVLRAARRCTSHSFIVSAVRGSNFHAGTFPFVCSVRMCS